MFSILDYLENYKDIKVMDVHWNNLDNLLCAILVYVPLETYSGKKSLNEFIEEAGKVKPAPEQSGEMVKTAYLALDIIKNSTRYKNMTFSNFINLSVTVNDCVSNFKVKKQL